MKTEIIAVDAALAAREFAAADENESEAVALALVELLFVETNAHYEQHRLATRTVQRLTDHLAGNVVDAIFAAVLQSETPSANTSFHSEASPEASTQDRHAVRTLPQRTPDAKHRDAMIPSDKASVGGVGGSSPSRDSRSSSSPEKLAGSPLVRPRRKVAEKERAVGHFVIPDILDLPIEDDESPDTKAWRAQCLQELTAAAKKPSFSKWATVARAFAPQSSSSSDPKMSMAVEIVESAPALLQKELQGKSALLSTASGPASSIKMKTNVDSFSNVVDLLPSSSSIQATTADGNGEDAHFSHSSRSHWSQLTRDSSTIGSLLQLGLPVSATTGKHDKSSASIAKKKSNGALHLNDKLSRKRSSMSSNNNSGIGQGHAGNGGKLLWKYERDGTGGGSQPFTPELSDFNVTALPSTIQLSSGVVLSQGESLVEGPTRIESPSTMSRKRFDLHQSLATDLMLQWSERDAVMSSSPSSASSPSLYSHHNHHNHHHLHHSDPYLKPYEEVPAEPIPAPPHLSSIAGSSLAIPRTHLAQSLSAPALRVRSPTNSKNGLPPSSLSSSVATANNSLANSSSYADLPSKHRPRTALLMGKPSPTSKVRPGNARGGLAGPSAETNAPATVKYLREFPKPQPGIVKLGQVDDSQRLAWISS